ncbi:hypothetical protein A2627_05520 [Candidatus Woesebacteria bacterium RIFCSPHIGHO2_01_FULL_39_28]|uniref:CYTH domain-containing protein n=1 Tax=Candidatus Woesebacteria bacterium RIFCSPHIGHO2_01_FULL_39_28 TaxID=1802496 RepID=A0A1F7YHN4_9BACT|nr:MAG: hypothetical protein A2627_05520 [Candidatus Woesebacteria bacterium RIFCSPHIGHO2_01_FULL_39_28]OGM56639.1 MAG: hypothetical protein A3A50_04715 [Candidatus Woesebacteria bacterium RIFCSPLOWO2_01_FULL_38_20]
MDNVEIEIKIRPEQPKLLTAWLEKNAKLIKSSHQIDYYFNPPHKDFVFKDKDGKKRADDYLRIRVDENDGGVTFKHWHRELEASGRGYLDEIETKLDNPDKLLKIFELLGFKISATIDKSRTSYSYGEFQFDCDEVKDLGTFVEIELKGKVNSPNKGFEKIHKILEQIGIKDWEEAKGGYVEMWWNK